MWEKGWVGFCHDYARINLTFYFDCVYGVATGWRDSVVSLPLPR